jgi:hypothetical protein
MGAVRQRLTTTTTDGHQDNNAFVRWLRALHVTALMGDTLDNYYRPASPISTRRASPGRLMESHTVVAQTAEGCRILSGPRVNASTIGGIHYHRLLWESLGDEDACTPRDLHDASGLQWGRLVHASAAGDPAPTDWFCPPRPILPAHLASLRGYLQLARTTPDVDRRIQALAAFHQSFVRLHPFYCGNQSIAMNIVNHILVKTAGAGIPHLVLDHLALRLTPTAYFALMARCIKRYVEPSGSPAERYQALARRRGLAFALVDALRQADSLANARALAHADTEAAGCLLLN